MPKMIKCKQCKKQGLEDKFHTELTEKLYSWIEKMNAEKLTPVEIENVIKSHFKDWENLPACFDTVVSHVVFFLLREKLFGTVTKIFFEVILIGGNMSEDAGLTKTV